MTPEELCVSRALDSLWEKFRSSSLAQSEQLQKKNLVESKGETSWTGSFAEGEIHASSTIELKDAEGLVFCWNLNFIYECEPNRLGRFLHWGMVRGEVCILTYTESVTYKSIYLIGDADLLTEPGKTIQLTDLGSFSQGISALAEACLQDLEHAYQNNLFPKIIELASEIEQPLASSPFKE